MIVWDKEKPVMLVGVAAFPHVAPSHGDAKLQGCIEPGKTFLPLSSATRQIMNRVPRIE